MNIVWQGQSIFLDYLDFTKNRLFRKQLVALRESFPAQLSPSTDINASASSKSNFLGPRTHRQGHAKSLQFIWSATGEASTPRDPFGYRASIDYHIHITTSSQHQRDLLVTSHSTTSINSLFHLPSTKLNHPHNAAPPTSPPKPPRLRTPRKRSPISNPHVTKRLLQNMVRVCCSAGRSAGRGEDDAEGGQGSRGEG